MEDLKLIAKDVVQKLGGVRATAKALGVSPSRVCRWKAVPMPQLNKVHALLGEGYEPETLRPDLAAQMGHKRATGHSEGEVVCR